MFIPDQFKRRRMRADQYACDDVAQNDRLFQTVKDNRDETCHDHDDGKVGNKGDNAVVHIQFWLSGVG